MNIPIALCGKKFLFENSKISIAKLFDQAITITHDIILNTIFIFKREWKKKQMFLVNKHQKPNNNKKLMNFSHYSNERCFFVFIFKIQFMIFRRCNYYCGAYKMFWISIRFLILTVFDSWSQLSLFVIWSKQTLGGFALNYRYCYHQFKYIWITNYKLFSCAFISPHFTSCVLNPDRIVRLFIFHKSKHNRPNGLHLM